MWAYTNHATSLRRKKNRQSPETVKKMKGFDEKRGRGGWQPHAVTHRWQQQRGGFCHVASLSCSHAHRDGAYTLLLGEQRSGEEGKGRKEAHLFYTSISLSCVSFQWYLIPHLACLTESSFLHVSRLPELVTTRTWAVDPSFGTVL